VDHSSRFSLILELQLYVSPASSDNWGQDVLGTDILRGGYFTRINFPGQTPNSPCMWDIKVVYADGTSTQKRFNLCKVDDIRAY
jgi:hypothetical protein